VAYLSDFVWFMITVLYPIAYPISRILDYIFGEEEEGHMSRNELEALVILQSPSHKREFGADLLARSGRYTCIYMCMCVYMYIYVYVCIYVYICVCEYTYVCVYIPVFSACL
jgi:hypothetical protein